MIFVQMGMWFSMRGRLIRLFFFFGDQASHTHPAHRPGHPLAEKSTPADGAHRARSHGMCCAALLVLLLLIFSARGAGLVARLLGLHHIPSHIQLFPEAMSTCACCRHPEGLREVTTSCAALPGVSITHMILAVGVFAWCVIRTRGRRPWLAWFQCSGKTFIWFHCKHTSHHLDPLLNALLGIGRYSRRLQKPSFEKYSLY